MLQIKFSPSFKQKHHSESDFTTQLLCSLQIQVVARHTVCAADCRASAVIDTNLQMQRNASLLYCSTLNNVLLNLKKSLVELRTFIFAALLVYRTISWGHVYMVPTQTPLHCSQI